MGFGKTKAAPGEKVSLTIEMENAILVTRFFFAPSLACFKKVELCVNGKKLAQGIQILGDYDGVVYGLPVGPLVLAICDKVTISATNVSLESSELACGLECLIHPDKHACGGKD
jgi:hypothetical protein